MIDPLFRAIEDRIDQLLSELNTLRAQQQQLQEAQAQWQLERQQLLERQTQAQQLLDDALARLDALEDQL
jgi:uncharacterized protein (TIGR02449 family)